MKKLIFALMLGSSPANAEEFYSTYSHDAASGNTDIAVVEGGLNEEYQEAKGMGRHLALKITDSYGGITDKFIEFRKLLNTYNVRVRLAGFCNSACTMYTSLDYVCVDPGMTFGFHHGSNLIATRQMLDMMAEPFSKHIAKVGMPSFKSGNMLTITGEQAVKMGAVKACKP